MKVAVALVLVALLGAACGGGGDGAGDAATPTVTTGSTTTTTEPTTTTTTAANVGATQDYRGGAITVHDYAQPVATDSPQPADAGYADDNVWAGLDAEVCIPDGAEGAVVSGLPWSLTFDDGALVTTTHTTYAGFPQPEYPLGDQPVSAGQCVRGWIVFPVPGDATPSGVSYAPLPGDTPLRWELVE